MFNITINDFRKPLSRLQYSKLSISTMYEL